MCSVKPEGFCRCCLSINRTLSPLGSFSDIFFRIIEGKSTIVSHLNPSDMFICWECMGEIKNIQKFQRKVENADVILHLAEMQNMSLESYTTLSKLSTKLNTEYNFIHNYEENFEPDDVVKEESIEVKVELYNDLDEVYEHDSFDNDESKYVKDLKTVEKTKKKALSLTEKQLKTMGKKFKKILIPKKEEYSDKHFRLKQIDEVELLEWLQRERMKTFYLFSKFKCETCIAGFSNEKALTYHNDAFHSEVNGSLTCDICKHRFRDKDTLATHCKEHYCTYECVLCGAVCFKRCQLYRHLRRDHTAIYECKKCGLQYWARREFFKHYKKMHKIFNCDYCGKTYNERHSIISHITKNHSSNKCHVCNKLFKSYRYLQNHISLLHRVTHDSDAYCVECNLQFDNNALFKRHLRTSVKHKPKEKRSYPCPECNKVYARVCTFNYHYRFVHKQEPKFNCDQCNKPFLNGFRLRQHKASVHDKITRPRNKICNLCGRGFSTNRILSNHVRTHTGERPFCCQYCPAAFAQKTAMTVHVRNIHYKEKNMFTNN